MARDGVLTEKDIIALGVIDEPQARDAWEELLLEYLDHISLTETQYELIEQRYSTIAAIIETSTRPELQGAIFLPQGSFRTRTVIRPAEDPVDVDAVVWLRDGRSLTAQQLYDLIRDELKERVRTEQGIEEKNRCVRVLYAGESLPFHLDVTPAKNAAGNINRDASGNLLIPDKKEIAADPTNGHKPSNPVDFAVWVQQASETKILLTSFRRAINFSERADVEPLPTHEEINAFDPLRGTIKLMKAHRDEYFGRRNLLEVKPISVLITTLACTAYLRVAAASRYAPKRPIDAIRAILREMPNCFDAPRPGERYRVENPVYREENFAEKWNKDPALSQAFMEWHQQIVRDLQLGLVQFESPVEFAEHFDLAFGHRSKTLAETALAKSLDQCVMIGLSPLAADKARNLNALSAVFGVSTQSKTQSPAPLNRLG